MPDPCPDDLVVLSGVLGRVTIAGRRFEVAEPCVGEWIRFSRDVQTIAVSFLAGATTTPPGPLVALAFLSRPLPPRFWKSARDATAACLRSDRTGRRPSPEWIGRHARPADVLAVLRAAATGTATGDVLDGTARAMLGLAQRKPADDGSAPTDWRWSSTFDLLASEYGWSPRDIRALSITQIRRYTDAIGARYRRQNRDDDDGSSANSRRSRDARGRESDINTADTTWQIGRRGAENATWDDVPDSVAEKFKAAGYSSLRDLHEKGRAKLERLEAEERARRGRPRDRG